MSAKNRKLFCNVESEIIDPDSGQVVGYIYRWNTGQRRKKWVGKRLKVFKLRLIDPKAGRHHDLD